jgi:hypothetical protein
MGIRGDVEETRFESGGKSVIGILMININKNGFISAGIIAIIALGLIILSGGGYEGYKYYQQKKESAKEEELKIKIEPQISIEKGLSEFVNILNEKFINSTSSSANKEENNINISSSSEILKIEQEFKKQETKNQGLVEKKSSEKNLKKIDLESIIPAVVKLKCYFSDDIEPSQIGSGVIVGSKKGDDQGEIINDTIATAGHVLINIKNYEQIKGCDVYISSNGGDSIEKRFYAVPFINYLYSKMVDSGGNEIVDGLDYALLQINSVKRDDIPRYSFIPPQDIKNIYEITEKFCQADRKLKIGEKIYALGYPDVGGETISVTDGIISGFYPFGQKLTVALSNGSSGGAVITEDGCFIAVPTVGVIGKGFVMNYGISTSLIAKLDFKGESTIALAERDIKRVNDVGSIFFAINEYFKKNGMVPENLDDYKLWEIFDEIKNDKNNPYYSYMFKNYPHKTYRYAYRSDKKSFHLGATLEETSEQFDKYHPKAYSDDDDDFNSQNQANWINGFNGFDSETCLPNDKIWYLQDGKWCWDLFMDYSKPQTTESQSLIGNPKFFANILEIVKNFLGLK